MFTGTKNANQESDVVVLAGLPLPSLSGTFSSSDARTLGIPPAMMVVTDRTRFIPCRPLLPGFAINTIFYAAILWMLFAIPSALNRKRRMNRGQ